MNLSSPKNGSVIHSRGENSKLVRQWRVIIVHTWLNSYICKAIVWQTKYWSNQKLWCNYFEKARCCNRKSTINAFIDQPWSSHTCLLLRNMKVEPRRKRLKAIKGVCSWGVEVARSGRELPFTSWALQTQSCLCRGYSRFHINMGRQNLLWVCASLIPEIQKCYSHAALFSWPTSVCDKCHICAWAERAERLNNGSST